MKMYSVVDEQFRQTSYFRSIEEAEKEIDGRRMYNREFTMENSDGIPGREYLAIKIVERDSQPCKACGRESENTPEKYPLYPYCRNCYYTGAAAEDRHLNDLCLFRSAFPDAEVGIEHTGGGCFWLAFRWPDDPDFYCATGGEAELPDDDRWNDGWGVVCRYTGDGDGDDFAVIRESRWDDEKNPVHLSKRQVIAAIKKDRETRKVAA